jgi:hypothetical protein
MKTKLFLKCFFKKISIFLITCLFLLNTGIIFSQNNNETNLIQMAILLDTSNSMDGLIGQAKSNLWKIVNELALTKKNGKVPNLEVALFEYGNNSLPQKNNYLKKIVPFTTDLDLISEELFNLDTNGGHEYCGAVIHDAVQDLKWSNNNKILKVIFIAGNEPFNQGKIDYKKSAKAAISKGIVINTIFCGDIQAGIDTNWKHGADLADGSYMNINHNLVEEYVKAPQDDEIMKLNEKLNKTYLGYGIIGKEKKELQVKQDKNAASMNKESEIQRAVSKSTLNYRNSSWDLLDAYENGTIDLKNIKDKELPEEMKGMNTKEKEKYINKMLKERKEIQNKIQVLNEERKKYINKVKKDNSKEESLDDVVIRVIKSQAIKKGYKVK